MVEQYWNRPCVTVGCFGIAKPLSTFCKRCHKKRLNRFEKIVGKFKPKPNEIIIIDEAALVQTGKKHYHDKLNSSLKKWLKNNEKE